MAGMGYKAISKKFNIPVAIIQSIIKKFKSYHTIKILNSQEKKLSLKCARNIVHFVKGLPRKF